MNNDSKISPLGLCFLSSFLYRSFYIIGLFNLIISIAKGDAIFSIIIGALIGFIFLLSYFVLDNDNPNEHIFNKIKNSFPKAISDLFIVVLIISVLIISSYVLYNLSLFINYNLLNDINILPIIILLLLCITYLANKGINTIIRTSGILIFVWILLVIISLLALISYSNPSNLYPIMTTSPIKILESGIDYSLFTITPIFLLLVIPKNKIENNAKYHKYMITTYVLNFLYFLINLILILSILGYKLTSILNYPDIIVSQKVSLLNFIERIEDLLSFKVMFDGFIFIALSIIYIKEGIVTVFKTNPSKKLIYFISFILILSSLYLHITNINILVPILVIILGIHFFLLFKRKGLNFTKSSQ